MNNTDLNFFITFFYFIVFSYSGHFEMSHKCPLYRGFLSSEKLPLIDIS